MKDDIAIIIDDFVGIFLWILAIFSTFISDYERAIFFGVLIIINILVSMK